MKVFNNGLCALLVLNLAEVSASVSRKRLLTSAVQQNQSASTLCGKTAAFKVGTPPARWCRFPPSPTFLVFIPLGTLEESFPRESPQSSAEFLGWSIV